jgi:hypothetical protein
VTVGVAEHLVAARRLAPRDLLIALRD